MNNLRAPMTQLVEVPINSTVGALQSVYFQNQPQLQSITGDRQVYILGIESISALTLPFSPLTPGNAVAAIADLQNATLTLNIAGTLNYQQVPLISMNRTWSNGSTSSWVADLFRLKDTYKVDWTKSYIQMVQAPITTPPFSYLFQVYYQYDNDLMD